MQCFKSNPVSPSDKDLSVKSILSKQNLNNNDGAIMADAGTLQCNGHVKGIPNLLEFKESTDAETPSCSQHQTPSAAPSPPSLSPNMKPQYRELFLACQEQATYFKDDISERGQRLHAALMAWQDFIILSDQFVQQTEAFACEYDFDEDTPGNGYRSFISVNNSCIAYGLGICKGLQASRSTLFFRKKFYMKEVEACSQILSSLCTCMKHLLILNDWSKDTNDLFACGKHSAEELFEKGETINQYCFYGRCLGFQYSDSIRAILRFISISMAGFSETFYAHDHDGTLLKTTRSVWTSGKYLLNPELRARRIVNLSQNAKIDFCKSFWFLAESELMHKIPSIVGSSIKINQIIEIPAEPLQTRNVRYSEGNIKKVQTETQNAVTDNEFLDVPVPSCHLGPGLSIQVRLLSYHRREGMVGLGSRSYRVWRKLPSRSPYILFHCHGGGFVAQSSKSHELYLRDWAVALDCPIFSVDYSLAPEAPFPRAVEEVFYAYCWMLKNSAHLGTTAERIVFAGDSAGANLCIALSLKCIERGVRLPDGQFLAYCPTLISFVPSPARLLCLMDPLLPFGFMMRCLEAYAAPSPELVIENSKSEEFIKEIRNASELEPHYKLNLDHHESNVSSRRTSVARSPLSSVAENSKWEQIKCNSNDQLLESGLSPQCGIEMAKEETEDSSENTFASASYHSQTVEHTDLPSMEDDDNSSCLSFEDDSQPIEHYPVVAHKKSDSEKYIDRFLGSYIVDGSTEEAKEVSEEDNKSCSERPQDNLKTMPAKTLSEENLFIDASKEALALETIQGKFNNAVHSISNTLNRYTQSYEIKKGDVSAQKSLHDLRNMDALIARSPSAEFTFQIPKDPFLSPYYASDEWLKQMPNTKILTLEMDPFLDDCVMFAKKLKRLNRPVTLDILKGLPHGFLNFTMISNEAMEGSKKCIILLKQLFEMETNSAESSPTTKTISNDTTEKSTMDVKKK